MQEKIEREKAKKKSAVFQEKSGPKTFDADD